MLDIKIRIPDYIIIGLIIVAGMTGFWFNLQEASAAERKYAVIYVENHQVTELSLSPGEQFTYNLTFGPNSSYNALIEIEGGRVRMLPLDENICPSAICSHTGWINYSYESIVCLPNQIMIVFTETPQGDPDNEGIDGLTY